MQMTQLQPQHASTKSTEFVEPFVFLEQPNSQTSQRQEVPKLV